MKIFILFTSNFDFAFRLRQNIGIFKVSDGISERIEGERIIRTGDAHGRTY